MFFISPPNTFQKASTWSERGSIRRVRRRRTFHRRVSSLPSTTSSVLPSPKPKIIVVDDEPEVAEVVCAILEDANIHANACTYSPDAFSSIQTNQPDAVILDVNMPQVGGVQLFEQLRNNADTLAIPVIFLSADTSTLQPRLSEYNALGVRLLRKPFTGDELLAVVTTVLRFGL